MGIFAAATAGAFRVKTATKETSKMVLITLIGAALIVVGVIGEFWEDFEATGVDTKLGSDNAEVISLLKSEATAAEGKIAEDNELQTKPQGMLPSRA